MSLTPTGGAISGPNSGVDAFPAASRRQLQLAGLLLAVVALGGVYVALRPGENVLDRMGYAVIPDQWDQPFWHHATDLGDPIMAVVGALLAAAWVFRRDRRRAVSCIAAPIIAIALCEVVIKPLVGRRLGSTYCYPSGHVTTAAVTVGAFVLAAPRRWKWAVGCAAAVVSLFVAVAVIADRQHYPSDALGALSLAVAVLLAVNSLNRAHFVIAWRSERRRRVSARSDSPVPQRHPIDANA